MSASLLALAPFFAQAPQFPPQHQAITGLAPPVPDAQRELRVLTVAAPAPDAINMHMVETRQGLVLFDALRRSDHVELVLAAMRRTGKRPLALFLTHAHTDHYGGVAFLKRHFPDLPVYAAPAVTAAMRADPNGDNGRRRAMFGERYPTQREIDAALPGHAVLDRKAIEVGGLRITPLVFGPSESPAATVYLLPQLGAAISGDLVNALTVPAPVESLEAWLVQLDEIERAVAPDTALHVGHGPSGPARPLIAEQRRFLVVLRGAVTAALAGDGRITDVERERIVRDLQLSFPHYQGAAALPPDELIRRAVEWVARQKTGKVGTVQPSGQPR
jgi:glyoxylase-like metal-dependent hydrolase (beta-lactamase superfamily II)